MFIYQVLEIPFGFLQIFHASFTFPAPKVFDYIGGTCSVDAFKPCASGSDGVDTFDTPSSIVRGMINFVAFFHKIKGSKLPSVLLSS